MSSTSNAQGLLVNVFRPTYRYEAGTGFVPSLTISNVSEIIAPRIKADALAISDSNVNTYIGSNAGNAATATASNVAIGYSAMSGASNSSNNVALGVFSLDGLGYSDSNVAVGDRTDITGRGGKNVLIGPNVTVRDGSYNILIGADISAGTVNYRVQIGSLLYGDLSTNRIGLLTSAPGVAVDISGLTVFRNKVGIQNANPQYSLDVNGAINVSDRLYVGPGTAISPIYSFRDLSSGMYQDTSASYGTGAVGISVNSMARLVVTSNKTYIYGNLDICGTVSAAAGLGGGGTIATNGTAAAPSFTFSNDLSTGLHWGGSSILAFDTSGRQSMTLSNGFLGIGTTTPRVTLDVSGDISANVYNGPGGTQAAPHYTFSDDRTTGVFFPGANIVGFTAGGAERMRISNANIGIGTKAPSNALDVSGVLRIIGTTGNITFSNGTIDVSGTQVFSSTGALTNTTATSNQIGGVTLSNGQVLSDNTESVRYITSNTVLSFPSGYGKAHVTVVGGGGGGGGADGFSAGGGGGAGYTASQMFTYAAAITIVIGSGGSYGQPGLNGGTGGATTAATTAFLSVLLSAPGGTGGTAGNSGANVAGAGGVGTYGGGGGSATEIADPLVSVAAGAGGIGKGLDGATGGASTGGTGGAAASNGGGTDGSALPEGGCGGGGGGVMGGRGGEMNNYSGSYSGGQGQGGSLGCGGGGGGAGDPVGGSPAPGGPGGSGYCIVRFLK